MPALRGRVNDYADLLTPAQRIELTEMYESVELVLGCQIALLTIQSLDGVHIDEYSLEVANTWGLGRAGIDDGVLITVAFEDRALRIEVGLGLEQVISDEAAAEVLRGMGREFAAGNSFAGIRTGSADIIRIMHANRALIGKKP